MKKQSNEELLQLLGITKLLKEYDNNKNVMSIQLVKPALSKDFMLAIIEDDNVSQQVKTQQKHYPTTIYEKACGICLGWFANRCDELKCQQLNGTTFFMGDAKILDRFSSNIEHMKD